MFPEHAAFYLKFEISDLKFRAGNCQPLLRAEGREIFSEVLFKQWRGESRFFCRWESARIGAHGARAKGSC
jgi:hypothetical protein